MSRRLLRTLAIAALCAVPVLAHSTGLFRAYLSSTGSDSNPCTLASPCRLLPAALAAVRDGGEIWMLDSANYNTAVVIVQKSVTILAVPGAVGSVLSIGGYEALSLQPIQAGTKIALRNLVIAKFPDGSAGNGIYLSGNAQLVVENCLVSGMPAGSGILVQGGGEALISNSTARGSVSGIWVGQGSHATITHTTVTDNFTYGIYVQGATAGTVASADISDTVVSGSLYGVYAESTDPTSVVKVSVRGSRIVRNGNWGLSTTSSGATVNLSASDNLITNNHVGVLVQGSAASKAWLSGNAVTENDTGLYNLSGTIESAGDNAVRNNTNDKLGVVGGVGTQ